MFLPFPAILAVLICLSKSNALHQNKAKECIQHWKSVYDLPSLLNKTPSEIENVSEDFTVSKMQQLARKPEEELVNVKDMLMEAEGERDKARGELKEMKQIAEGANKRLNTDDPTELKSVLESLSKANQELKIKEKAIDFLKSELEKARDLEARLVEKDASLEKLKEEFDDAKFFEAEMLELLSRAKIRVEELDAEVEEGKESEKKMLDSFAAQTKKLEETKILLEESKLEIGSLQEKIENLEASTEQKRCEGKLLLQEEVESLKSEIGLARENLSRAREGEKQAELRAKNLLEETEKLKNQLKIAMEADENSKKAMDDLALALKEVATEANKAKENLVLTQDELRNFKREAEELKEKLKRLEENHKTLLQEFKKDADLYRNTAERLRLEAEESHLAWNGKETGFVDCIRRAEDEKASALEENTKLLEMLNAAENVSKAAKLETLKLRDILKQALNEANAAKEAAVIAKAENSQLKGIIADKNEALMFITRENENLRIDEVAAREKIQELKRLLSEASGKEFKAEDKENEHKQKQQNQAEKEHKHARKISNAFSLNLRDLIIHNKHKDNADEDQKIADKYNKNEEDEDSENGDLLKGSIFDVAESPIAAAQHRPTNHPAFTVDGEAVNSEDTDHLDGDHIDDLEIERSSGKKKALLGRFGSILTRRSTGSHHHRKEPSMGGPVDGQKTEITTSEGIIRKEAVANGEEGHRRDLPIGE